MRLTSTNLKIKKRPLSSYVATKRSLRKPLQENKQDNMTHVESYNDLQQQFQIINDDQFRQSQNSYSIRASQKPYKVS